MKKRKSRRITAANIGHFESKPEPPDPILSEIERKRKHHIPLTDEDVAWLIVADDLAEANRTEDPPMVYPDEFDGEEFDRLMNEGVERQEQQRLARREARNAAARRRYAAKKAAAKKAATKKGKGVR